MQAGTAHYRQYYLCHGNIGGVERNLPSIPQDRRDNIQRNDRSGVGHPQPDLQLEILRGRQVHYNISWKYRWHTAECYVFIYVIYFHPQLHAREESTLSPTVLHKCR